MAELQGVFFVERMKDVYGKMAKAEGKMEAMCEQCAGGKSVAFLSYIVHLRRLRVFSRHTPLMRSPLAFFCMRIYSNQTFGGSYLPLRTHPLPTALAL